MWPYLLSLVGIFLTFLMPKVSLLGTILCFRTYNLPTSMIIAHYFCVYILISTAQPLLGWSFFSTNDQQTSPSETHTTSIMLHPAGDSNNPGREIDDSLERSLSMQCCQAIKEYFEETTPSVKILLSRFPGEAVEPLQNISFSNRMGVDLYVSIHMYEHNQVKPELFIYTFAQNPATDFIEKKSTDLTFLPYDQAYKLSLKKTKEYGSLFYSSCSTAPNKTAIVCHQPLAIPFKPLRGIIAPALGIEIGLAHKNESQKIVPVIAQALKTLVVP